MAHEDGIRSVGGKAIYRNFYRNRDSLLNNLLSLSRLCSLSSTISARELIAVWVKAGNVAHVQNQYRALFYTEVKNNDPASKVKTYLHIVEVWMTILITFTSGIGSGRARILIVENETQWNHFERVNIILISMWSCRVRVTQQCKYYVDDHVT